VIVLRMYRRGGEVVGAACDKELIGRSLREGRTKLDVAESFYHGEEADEEMLINRLRMATIANLVGERTVSIASKHKMIDEQCVMLIEGVPHVQMVKM